MRVLVAHAAWMPERAATLGRLCGQLGASAQVLASERREPAYLWARGLWHEAAARSGPVVLLNDDVEVCPDFLDACDALATAAPGEIISLHCQAPGAVDVAASGARWARSYWLTGPAYLLPSGMAATLLDFWDALPFEIATRLNEDNVAIHWAWANQRPILQCLPALARHDVTVPSSLGYDAHPHRSPAVDWVSWDLERSGAPYEGLQDWPAPVAPIHYVENPWAPAAALMRFRTFVQDGVPICTACLDAPALYRGPGVQLCGACGGKVAVAAMGRVLR